MATFRSELGVLGRLSAPVALTQIGLMMTGVVDTLMVSRIGTHELAATAVANMWQWAWISIGMGMVMGTDPMISQAHGRGDGPGTGLALQRGLVIALLVSIPLCCAQLLTESGLLLLGQDARVAELAATYNIIKLPTIPLFLGYSALRAYLQGRGIMAPATWVMWIGNAFNVVLNWMLIFGRLGMPALGLEGAAIASSLTMLILFLGLILWIRVFQLHAGAWRPWDRASLALSGLSQVVRLGIPVGITMALESWAFSAATFMSGWLGVEAVGSHHIVLNMAALSFMVPLGIAQGSATRVGNLIGAGDEDGMRRAAFAALVLGAGVMVLSAFAFTVFRHELPRLYTDDVGVGALAATILPLAGAFQLSDGTQVVASGVLRGMGRPRAAAVVNLVGYYVLALPLAYVLGFSMSMGLWGIWMALVVGLGVVALGLVIWVRRTARRPISELTVAVASSAA